MSYCIKEGKDEIIFLSEEDERKENPVPLSDEIDREDMGVRLPDGGINYDCSCNKGLHGLLTNECGLQFRAFYECAMKTDRDDIGACNDVYTEFQMCNMDRLERLHVDSGSKQEKASETSEQTEESASTSEKTTDSKSESDDKD